MSDSHHTPESKNVIPAPFQGSTTAFRHGGGSLGKPPEQTMTPGFVLGALRQWWKIAAPVGLILATVGGSLVWMFFEPSYRASAWLQISELTPYIAFESREQSKQFVNTQIQLLQSPMVLGPVVADAEIRKVLPELREEPMPIEWLKNQIRVAQIGRSELYEVSLRNPSQRSVALVVNAVIQKYLDLLVQQDARQNENVLALLEEEKRRRSHEVRRLREDIRKLTEQVTGTDPFMVDPTREFTSHKPLLADLQSRLTEAKIQQQVAEARHRLFEKVIAEEESKEGLDKRDDREIDRFVNENATVRALEERMAVKREELRKIESISKNPAESGEYRRVLQEIDGEKGHREAFAAVRGKVEQLLDLQGQSEEAQKDPKYEALSKEAKQLCPDAALLTELKSDIQQLRELAANAKQGVDDPEFKQRSARINEQYTEDLTLACIQASVQRLLGIKADSAQGEDHPKYRKQLRQFRADYGHTGSLVLLKKNLRRQAIARVQENSRTAREEENTLISRNVERYKIEETLLQERFDEELKTLKKYKADSLEILFKRDELVRSRDVMEKIADRSLRLDDKRRAPSRVMLLRAAKEPLAPVEKIPYKMLTLVVVGGLFFPFLVAVGWERVLQRVNSPHQLEHDSDMIVVGETPRLPVRPHGSRRSRGRYARRNLGIFEESIDGVRTCLMLSEPLRDLQVLAVTSASKKEGKTSVASQLVVSIARASGTATLLVDGDMRSPDIHNVFDIPLKPGLVEVMTAKCDLDEAIVTDWSQYVHLLPAGRLRTNPHKLMGNGKVKELFDELRSRYRYIVIDTPPVLAASEALVLAKTADASLMCAMQDCSRLDQVRKGYNRLLAAGARPAGMVLNGVPVKRYAYRYGNYAYDRE